MAFHFGFCNDDDDDTDGPIDVVAGDTRETIEHDAIESNIPTPPPVQTLSLEKMVGVISQYVFLHSFFGRSCFGGDQNTFCIDVNVKTCRFDLRHTIQETRAHKVDMLIHHSFMACQNT